MTLHLIKLCVGADSIDDLAQWQAKRLAERKKRSGKAEIVHTTRQTPKRADELLDGGSIYWVIKGVIRVRQLIKKIEPIVRDGQPRTKLVLDRKLVRVAPRQMRAFQGWRYLEPEQAPPDLSKGDTMADMPPEMAAELKRLGLL